MQEWLDLGGFIYSVAAALFVLWVIIRAWTRPRSEETPDQAPAESPPTPRVRWSLRGELARLFLTDDVMSNSPAGDASTHPSGVQSKPLVSATKRNGETGESTVATPKPDGSEAISFPDIFEGMARAIQAKKLTETEALKLFCQVSPGSSPRYKVARERLQAALAALGSTEYWEMDERGQRTGEKVLLQK